MSQTIEQIVKIFKFHFNAFSEIDLFFILFRLKCNHRFLLQHKVILGIFILGIQANLFQTNFKFLLRRLWLLSQTELLIILLVSMEWKRFLKTFYFILRKVVHVYRNFYIVIFIDIFWILFSITKAWKYMYIGGSATFLSNIVAFEEWSLTSPWATCKERSVIFYFATQSRKGITVILLTISIHGVFFSIILLSWSIIHSQSRCSILAVMLIIHKVYSPSFRITTYCTYAIESADQVLFPIFDLSERCIEKLSIWHCSHNLLALSEH